MVIAYGSAVSDVVSIIDKAEGTGGFREEAGEYVVKIDVTYPIHSFNPNVSVSDLSVL